MAKPIETENRSRREQEEVELEAFFEMANRPGKLKQAQMIEKAKKEAERKELADFFYKGLLILCFVMLACSMAELGVVIWGLHS